jgi:hypothetical protein
MADPTMPLAVTVAVTVMTVISWYGMLRTSVQLLELDIQASKSAEADIENSFDDLEAQESKLNDWRKLWLLSRSTPDVVLLQFWGRDRLDRIRKKLNRIQDTFQTTRKQLAAYDGLDEEKWKKMNIGRKKLMKKKWVWRKKAHVQTLIDTMPKDFTVVEHEANTGWAERKLLLSRDFGHTTPFHTFTAYMLVKIAQQIRGDVDALFTLAQEVRRNYTIALDLDIFEASTAVSEDKEAPQLYDAFNARRLNLNLLLRDANQESEELLRIEVEKIAQEGAAGDRVRDAFDALLRGPVGTQHICHVASKSFGISKSTRSPRGCPKLQFSFRDIFALQNPLTYDPQKVCFRDHNLILGDLSTFRAAFELAQACLLFLRTTWFARICRCGVRCGMIPEERWHQFGIEMGAIDHKTMLWRNPDGSPQPWEFDVNHCWCNTVSPWSGLNRPLRHLGLLLVELAFGHPVLLNTFDSPDGTPAVESLWILAKAPQARPCWEALGVEDTLELVKKTFHGSDEVMEAVRFCLCGSFPPAPTDEEWEQCLKHFYFKVVRP